MALDTLALRTYEEHAADWLTHHWRAVLADEPGAGKTVEVLAALERAGVARTLVVCPLSVVHRWTDETPRWTRMWPLELTGPAGRRLAAIQRVPEHDGVVAVTNYEAARIDVDHLRRVPWHAVVYDECHPAGTRVNTLSGNVPIEVLRPGDGVLSFDGSNVVLSTVTHTFDRETEEPLWQLGTTRMTPAHPVWTRRGYVPVENIRDGDQGLCLVRGALHGAGAFRARPEALLFQAVLYEVAGDGRVPGAESPFDARGDLAPRCAGKAEEASRRADQSVPLSRRIATFRRGESATGLPRARDPGRQRQASDAGTTAAGRRPGLADRSDRPNRTAGAPADALQDRCGEYRASDRGRGRRAFAPVEEAAGAGSPQRSISCRERLDILPLLEPSGDRASGRRRRVYNIETTLGNYFADGVLVHNSHRLKDRRSKAFQTARILALQAPVFWAVTGTPILNRPEELWSLLHLIDPQRWSSYWRFVDAYCVTELLRARGGHQPVRQVTGMRPGMDDVLRTQLGDVMLRRRLEDILPELPEITETTVRIDLSAVERRMYDQMADSFYVKGDDFEVIARNDVSRITRLRQIANDWAVLSAAPEEREWSAKLRTLRDLVDDLDPEPVVVFSAFARVVRRVSRLLDCPYIAGDVSQTEREVHLHQFQSGRHRVIAGTIGAMGEGIDLYRGRHVVFVDRDWTPARNDQAVARVHRYGQTADRVFVHNLVARDTVDQFIDATLRRKEAVIDALVGRRWSEVLRGENG